MKKSISVCTMDAILTHPPEIFTVAEIHKQVESVMEKTINKAVISNYMTTVFKKEDILVNVSRKRPCTYKLTEFGIEKLAKRKEAALHRNQRKTVPFTDQTIKNTYTPPSQPDEVDILTIGKAIVETITDLKQENQKLKDRIVDAATLHHADVKAFKQVIKEKESTIRELQADVERLNKANTIKNRTMKLSEIATFR